MAVLPDPPSPTVDAIYAAYEARRESGWREHLGASLIGQECERSLWLSFRWATRAAHAGRILRLFDTGQREEARLIADLRAAGIQVLDRDPDTGRQWAVSAVRGHFGGSMDATAIGVLEAPKTWHLVEMKSHNAKSFAELKKKGVAAAKPQHVAQMQVYMALAGLERALYLAVCKDSDELYAERIAHDPAAATRLLVKAERIIGADRPPPRISDDPGYFVCRMCDHRAACHDGALPARNCRTCLSSTPIDGGKWQCDRFGKTLTRAEQEAGCALHLFVPDLVAGEQVDAGDDFVAYRLATGEEWRDGPG